MRCQIGVFPAGFPINWQEFDAFLFNGEQQQGAFAFIRVEVCKRLFIHVRFDGHIEHIFHGGKISNGRL